MNKEEITVSAEVKTYLMDLYSQIEYELQEQYNDEVQKLQQENEELKEKNKKLKQWDCNKDSRNSRQRVANAKLIKENKKYKEVIDKAIEELKKGLHELEIRRREEVYIEQYIEQSIDILKEVK